MNVLHAYTFQKTTTRNNVRWESSSSILVFHIDTTNSSGIATDTMSSIFTSAFAQWNDVDGPKFSTVFDNSGAREGRNDIVFSRDSFLFGGSSVLAVARNTFNNDTGQILESDIYIKDTVLYSSDSSLKQYVGNIVVHELGHTLGLDHSEELFSTMFYQQIKGQHTLASDDMAGKQALYGVTQSSGRIQGKIAGGNSVIPVFGATVRLISTLEGKVISSTISDEDGSFSFTNLSSDDLYYIYVSPTLLPERLSAHYQTIRSDFCSGYASYGGSFYETCDRGRRGNPQGIRIDSSNSVDLGIVTIKCGLEVPLNYLSSRGGTYNLVEGSSILGESMVGFFTDSDITNNLYDEINVDLSQYSFSESDLYLDVKLVTHDLLSNAVYDVVVSSTGTSSGTLSSSVDTDGNPSFNLQGSFSINSITPSHNNFTIKITPKSFADYLLATSFSDLDELIPAYSSVASKKAFYQLIVSVVQGTGSTRRLYGHYPYSTSRDNSSCMDGPKTYSVKSANSISNSQIVTTNRASAEAEAVDALACGTVALIGDDQGPSSGGGLWVIALGFILGFAFRFSRIKVYSV